MTNSVTEQAFDDQGPPVVATNLARVARYRCTACGNLTRFDVVSTRQTRAFHHYSMGGEVSIEAEQVLSESIDEVSCTWCGSGAKVEVRTEDARA